MWHRESLGRNIFLGEVEVPLDTWDWDSEPTWLPLQPRVRQPARVGRPSDAGVPPAPSPAYPPFPLLQPPLTPPLAEPPLGLATLLPAPPRRLGPPARCTPSGSGDLTPRWPLSLGPAPAPDLTAFRRSHTLPTTSPAAGCSPFPSSTSPPAPRVSAPREATLDGTWKEGASGLARARGVRRGHAAAGSEPSLWAGAGLPPSGELHFWVKEAQDLVPLRSGTPDTYVQW